MLEAMRRGKRWLISATIFLVGGVFVLYLSGSGGGPAGPTGAMVELGDRRYSAQDLQLAYENQETRFRERLGEDFNRAMLEQYLEQAARESIIARAVLSHEAEAMGLHVSDEEVRRFLRELFRNANGTFDPEEMRAYARQRYGSETRFVQDVRDELLVGKFQRLLGSTGFVSKSEARDALRYKGEEVQIAYVAIDPATFGENAEIDEDAIAKILAEEAEGLQEDYDRSGTTYNNPEAVRARHILFRVDRAADDTAREALRTLAESVLERANNGEDFAALAEEFSQDPGSAVKGGDLGFFIRGQMVADFETAAFGAEPGSPAQIVATEFGFHILKVEERRAALVRSFDEVARELAEKRFRKRAGTERAEALAGKLSEAVAGGESLTDAARAQGLTLERPDWITHSVSGQIESLGAVPTLVDVAFTLPDDAPSSPEIFEVGDRLVLIERLDRRFAEDEVISAGIDGERQRILEEWSNTTQREWVQSARTELEESGELKIRFDPPPGAPAS